MAVQTAKIIYTASELENAIALIRSLALTKGESSVTITVGDVSVNVPTQEVVSALESSLSTLSGDVDTKTTAINTDLTNTKGRVATLETDVATAKSNIQTLQNTSVKSSDLATINGQSLTSGGNIQVETGWTNALTYEVVE